MVFSLIASYPGQKERIQKNFHVLPIFTELGQDLTRDITNCERLSGVFYLILGVDPSY